MTTRMVKDRMISLVTRNNGLSRMKQPRDGLEPPPQRLLLRKRDRIKSL
jgi:hypothetical protein